MSFHDLLLALRETSFATAIREGISWFPWLESIHVVAIVTVVGTISIIDMRLLGLPAHRKSLRLLTKDVLPLTWGAFVVAAITGFLLFSSQPDRYWALFEFKAKMLLLLLAGVNMLFFHVITFRNAHLWDELTQTPWAAKLAGLISLVIWFGVVVFGRLIGFEL